MARTSKVAHLSPSCESLLHCWSDRTTMRFCSRCITRQRQTLGAIAAIVSDDGERAKALRHLIGDETDTRGTHRD